MPAALSRGRHRQKVGRGASRQDPSYCPTRAHMPVRMPDIDGFTIHLRREQIDLPDFFGRPRVDSVGDFIGHPDRYQAELAGGANRK